MTELLQILGKDAKEGAAIAELLETVERHIRIGAGGTIHDLRVVLDGDTVVMSGRTNTHFNKGLATHAALAGAPEREIRNEIDVHP